MQTILKQIAKKNSFTLNEYKPLSGGDINAVFLLKCTEGHFVIKVNDAAKFPKIFENEAKGLKLLQASKSFKTPKVIATGELKGNSYLLLEHIEKGPKKPQFWRYFAQNLAKLHKTTQTHFGLNHDNYIGSLPQVNGFEETSATFYSNQRLKPQFALAQEKGFKFENLDFLFQNISSIIPNEAPSLIHGDFWNGNYLVSKKGEPVLIDPAVAFAPRELDIAMMQLFGGFPKEVFSVYDEIFPLKSDWEARVKLFQLYYVLVHLNLFGSGYLPQVKSIVNAFT